MSYKLGIKPVLMVMILLISPSSCHVHHHQLKAAKPDASNTNNVINSSSPDGECGVIEPMAMDCDALSSPDIHELDLLFPSFIIPSVETTVKDLTFDLKEYGIKPDISYHIIAVRHRTTTEMLHHIIMRSCHDVRDTRHNLLVSDYRTRDICHTMIDTWGKKNNISGDHCFADDYGVMIGQSGFMKINVELHHNNPSHCTGVWDTPGITLYYTETLRPNSATVLSIETSPFAIPPHQTSYTVSGTCTKHKTSSFSSPITIVKYGTHMHRFGRSYRLEHRRNGILINMFDHNAYVVGAVHVATLVHPIVIQPGDELTIFCEFSTEDYGETVISGPATDTNEMCIAFFVVYPGESILSMPVCHV